MSNFSDETVAFHRSHLRSREDYAREVGRPWQDLTFDESDTKLLSVRRQRLLRLARFRDPVALNMVDANAVLAVMALVVLYLIFSTPGAVTWWPLVILSVVIIASPLVFRQVIKRLVLPEVDDFIALRTDAEDDYRGTWNGIDEDLASAGLQLHEKRGSGRFLSNHGIVTLVTVDGKLDYLVNGKMVQRPYSDLAGAS